MNKKKTGDAVIFDASKCEFNFDTAIVDLANIDDICADTINLDDIEPIRRTKERVVSCEGRMKMSSTLPVV